MILCMEIWKELKILKKANGNEYYFEGYKISNYGRVISVKGNKEKYLNGRLDNLGYKSYCLMDTNGKKTNHRGHTMVMQTFVGIPENGMVICHYDDIKTNNHIDNLRYDTRKANWQDIKRNNVMSRKKSK